MTHSRSRVTDFLVSLLLVLMGVLGYYAGSTNEFSWAVYFAGVAEIFVAPFYPGYRLAYPPLVALTLCASFAFGFRLDSRISRLALFTISLAAWIVVGLFTIIR